MGRTKRRRRERRSDNNFAANASQDERDLMQWMKRREWRPAVPLRLCRFPQTARGLMALRSVAAGSVIMSVPMDLVVTREKAVAVLGPECGPLSTHQALSLFLVEERSRGEDSAWWHYLESLPKRYTVPFFASASELSLFPDYVREKCSAQRLLLQEKFDAVKAFRSVSAEEFAWAWFSVNTRAVYFKSSPQEDPEDCLALAPFLDMFNHSGEAKVRAGVDLVAPGAGSHSFYQIVTEKRIEKYEEAFINYGAHANLSLFVEYGFVLPSNPHECVPISPARLAHSLGRGGKDALLLLTSTGLAENMSVTESGLSWNALACTHIVLSGLGGSDWTAVYEVASFEDVVPRNVVLKVLDVLRTDIAGSIDSLQHLKLSQSAEIGLQLLRGHLNIVRKAIGAVKNNVG